MLTIEELKTISNLLYTGRWNMSLKEIDKVIKPLINALAKEIDLGKVK